MRRYLPIQLLVALFLGCTAVVLGMTIDQAQRSNEARQAMVELGDQRLALNRLAGELEHQLADLQRYARQYANSGNARFRDAHEALLTEIKGRAALVMEDATAAPESAGGAFRATLDQSALQPAEVRSLRLAFETLVLLGEGQSRLLTDMPAGEASPATLLAVTAPGREDLAGQLHQHINAMRSSANARIEQALSDRHSQIQLLIRQQLVLLIALSLLVLLAFAITHRYAVRPLRRLLDAATAIGGGQYDTRAPKSGVREIVELATTVNWMATSFQADLEARRAEQEQAQRMEQRLRRISDLTPGVIWEVRLDEHQRPYVTFIGGSYESLFAVPREKVTQDFTALLDGIHPKDRASVVKTISHAAREHEDFISEHRVLGPDGVYFWARTHGRRNTLSDGTPVWNGLTVDINEIQQLRQKLESALADAEAGNRSKTDFIANLSHEIRTPMNAILGMSHLAMQTELSERQRDYLRRIDNSARVLLRIINAILDVSKIETGRMELEHSEFALEQVLESTNDVVAPRAEEKNLDLSFDVAPDVPRLLIGDSLRLGQVLISLLDNAIKFTEKGHVRLSIERMSGGEGEVRLHGLVEDTGPGITREAIDGLFEPFAQADSSITRQHGGMGLGLTVSRQLVRLMGGDIQVDSEPGRGSRFHFEVQLGVQQDNQSALEQAATAMGPLRCLVVDDSRSSRSILQSALHAFGFEVTGVASGPDAVQAATRQNFDCILVDWRMPDMDGIETAQRLRPLVDERTRIILVTSYGRDEVLQEIDAESRHIDGMLLKPVSSSVLLDTIAESRREPEADFDTAGEGPAAPNLDGRKIILAEDSDIGRHVLRKLISRTGAELRAVTNGRQAVAAHREAPAELIILDLQMPVLDGWAAAREIRGTLKDVETPVLALTAEKRPNLAARCHEAGMNDVLSKPVEVTALYTALADWLGVPLPAPVRAPAPTEPDLQIRGVEFTAGLARTGGNRRFFLEALLRLARESAGAPEEMRAALDRGDWDALRRLGHRWRGTAANLGAVAIADHCEALEQTAEAGREADARGALDDLEQAIEQFHAALPNEPLANENGPRRRLDRSTLDELEQLVRAGDAEARRLSQTLSAHGAGEVLLERIREHLNAYEFEQAAQLLPELRAAEV